VVWRPTLAVSTKRTVIERYLNDALAVSWRFCRMIKPLSNGAPLAGRGSDVWSVA